MEKLSLQMQNSGSVPAQANGSQVAALTRQVEDLTRALETKDKQIEQLETMLFEAQQKYDKDVEELAKLAADHIVPLERTVQRQRKTIEKAKELREFLKCTICMDARRDCVLIPCTHFICCSGCAQKLMGQEQYGTHKCPVCRAQIASVIKVFQV
jgi:glutamate racemase